jgi:hypothetical protein
MATVVVSVMCLALVIVGGMMLSQGILTSADNAAVSVAAISSREADISRSAVSELTVESVTFDDALRARVRNNGLDKIAAYDRWDIIVRYEDAYGASYATWLPYAAGTPGNNEWTVADIWLNGPNEFYDPGILNPQEELVIYAPLDPAPAAGTEAEVTVIAPNGVYDTLSFTVPAAGMFVPHAETFAIDGTGYYYLLGGVAADGPAVTETTGTINRWRTGRWLLYDQSDTSQDARHCFSLNGVSALPSGTWTVTYRGRANGAWYGFGNYAQLNIDVLIRRADGTVRQTIATRVAIVNLTNFNNWQTLSATYSFPGYTVVDESDLLEIDFYGQSTGQGPSNYYNSINLDVDDTSLSASNLTRITY